VGAASADGSGRTAPHHGAWTAVHLDAVEPVEWRGGALRWRPMRAALGTRVTGMATYIAERVGQAPGSRRRSSASRS
jgi:hypothetical protein